MHNAVMVIKLNARSSMCVFGADALWLQTNPLQAFKMQLVLSTRGATASASASYWELLMHLEACLV